MPELVKSRLYENFAFDMYGPAERIQDYIEERLLLAGEITEKETDELRQMLAELAEDCPFMGETVVLKATNHLVQPREDLASGDDNSTLLVATTFVATLSSFRIGNFPTPDRTRIQNSLAAVSCALVEINNEVIESVFYTPVVDAIIYPCMPELN